MIKLKKPLQHILDRDSQFEIILVGCGGTGSFVAQDIARLAWHLKQDGKDMKTLFIDYDAVEEKNVGRQNFAPIDVGSGKAEALSTRYNRAYGLEIAYFNDGADKWEPMLKRHEFRGTVTVLIGCVDNTAARKRILDIARKYQSFSRKVFWLDCGNFENAGQVLIGNSGEKSPNFKKSISLGLCSDIPFPSVIHPELTALEKIEKKKVSCADLALQNAQSLMINRAVSTFAGQYLYDILIKRTLLKYATYISLGGGAATSKFLNKNIWDKK